MTTRGQKRSNEVITSQTSDSGTILSMLTTNNQPEKSMEGEPQTDPANAKDVEVMNIEGPANAKDPVSTKDLSTDPAIARDAG